MLLSADPKDVDWQKQGKLASEGRPPTAECKRSTARERVLPSPHPNINIKENVSDRDVNQSGPLSPLLLTLYLSGAQRYVMMNYRI